jgi:hypothetical protein
LDFRKRIFSDYAIIFEGTEAGRERTIVSDSFGEKWSWFAVMYRLTGGEIVHLEKITKLSLLECLTWLSYETDLESQNKVNYDSKK